MHKNGTEMLDDIKYSFLFSNISYDMNLEATPSGRSFLHWRVMYSVMYILLYLFP